MKFLKNLLLPMRKLAPMEAYVEGLTSASMDLTVRAAPEDLKVATAQALEVMAFAGSFAKGLRKSSMGMRTDWPFPFEQIVTEAAGFYFYFVASPHLSRSDDDDDREVDAYFESLKLTIAICGSLIHNLSGRTISDEFIGGRVVTYSDVKRRSDSLVDTLRSFILRAWNPAHSSRPSLDLSSELIPLEAAIASMPVEAVRDACRELYDEKIKNPNAY